MVAGTASLIGRPARLFTLVGGVVSLLQGASNLAFRMIPALDHAFPALLATTHMIPLHAVLHIATGIVALAVLARGGERGPKWFAAGFGSFYMVLAIVGLTIGHPTVLGLQPFDHGIHAVIGGVGLVAAVLDRHTSARRHVSAH